MADPSYSTAAIVEIPVFSKVTPSTQYLQESNVKISDSPELLNQSFFSFSCPA
jgi:hypothetical protein